jgi:hypothetical protein
MASVELNTNELRDYLRENRISMVALSKSMGRSAGYMANVVNCTSSMSRPAYDAMCKALGVEPGVFTKPLPAPVPSTYRLNLVYSDSKVLLQLMRGEEVVSGAWAIVKEQSHLGFIQAISYAAHMMYKFAEQKELDNKESA